MVRVNREKFVDSACLDCRVACGRRVCRFGCCDVEFFDRFVDFVLVLLRWRSLCLCRLLLLLLFVLLVLPCRDGFLCLTHILFCLLLFLFFVLRLFFIIATQSREETDSGLGRNRQLIVLTLFRVLLSNF
ncbi:hypothetical protein SNK04_012833 [Fusarium graminearum]